MDLVPDPWTVDAATLIRRQREATDALRPSGMFGDYRGILHVDTKPGPNWTPLEPPPQGEA
jgi:hypothetical protein